MEKCRQQYRTSEVASKGNESNAQSIANSAA